MKTLAITCAKISRYLAKLNGGDGFALPGLVAKRLDRQILKKLTQNNFPQGIVVVTGTNGKTTTAKLIADILHQAGVSYIYNRTGSNLERGIIAELIKHADTRGKISAQMAIFEVDEANIPIVFAQIQARLVVVTNLFRDQLDRYGELGTTADMIARGLKTQTNAAVLLNADDPLVASLGQVNDKKYHFFGIADYNGPYLTHDRTADSSHSPHSIARLIYSKRHFSHLGIYRSQNNDFIRPKPDFELIKLSSKSSEQILRVVYDKQEHAFSTKLLGLYNIYNVLVAVSVASLLNIDEKITTKALQKSQSAFGRNEAILYKRHQINLVLIKNPTGFNQAILTYLQEKESSVLLIVNDNFADGRDVSWLWDSAIEDIKSQKIVASGLRGADMGLRLKYADKSYQYEADPVKALELLCRDNSPKKQLYILATYTAMLTMRKTLLQQTPTGRQIG